MDTKSSHTSQHSVKDFVTPKSKDEGLEYVYAIREEVTEFYKIGKTRDPKKRMSDLQTGNPRKLIFKRVIKVKGEENSRKAEKMMHTKLGDDKGGIIRCNGGGTEWFAIPKEEGKKRLYDMMEQVAKECGGEDVTKKKEFNNEHVEKKEGC